MQRHSEASGYSSSLIHETNNGNAQLTMPWIRYLCDEDTCIGRALLAKLRLANVVPCGASPSSQADRID